MIEGARAVVKRRSELKPRKSKTMAEYRKLVRRDRGARWWTPDAFAVHRTFYAAVAAYDAVLEEELDEGLLQWGLTERNTGSTREQLVLALAGVLQASGRLEDLRRLFPRDHPQRPASETSKRRKVEDAAASTACARPRISTSPPKPARVLQQSPGHALVPAGFHPPHA